MANLQWERIAARYRQARLGEAEDATFFTAFGAPQEAAAVISAEDLRDAMLREAPVLLDVCLADDIARRTDMIPGATLRNPYAVDRWAEALPRDRSIAVYCIYGFQVSGGAGTAAARLRRAIPDGWHRGMARNRRQYRAAGRQHVRCVIRCEGGQRHERAAAFPAWRNVER